MRLYMWHALLRGPRRADNTYRKTDDEIRRLRDTAAAIPAGRSLERRTVAALGGGVPSGWPSRWSYSRPSRLPVVPTGQRRPTLRRARPRLREKSLLDLFPTANATTCLDAMPAPAIQHRRKTHGRNRKEVKATGWSIAVTSPKGRARGRGGAGPRDRGATHGSAPDPYLYEAQPRHGGVSDATSGRRRARAHQHAAGRWSWRRWRMPSDRRWVMAQRRAVVGPTVWPEDKRKITSAFSII